MDKTLKSEDTKRSSKSVRPMKPEPMALTDRDKGILTRIWEDRMLFTSQIRRIFFSGKTRANARLRRLWENGYLDRYFLPTLMFHGSTEALHLLGRKGVDAVAVTLGVERAEIVRGMSYLKQKIRAHSFLLSLDHILAVADFRIAFAETMKNRPNIILEGWIPERMCEESYRFWRIGGKVVGKLRPDGYCQLRERGMAPEEKRYSFFVEVDLGTMSSKAFRHKAQRYLDYSESGGYEKRFGCKYFRVLVATTGQQRLANLKQTTEELTDSIFWFTTLEQIWQGKAFDAIWMKAGQEGLYPML